MKVATLVGGLVLAVLASPLATSTLAAVNPHTTLAGRNIVLVAAPQHHTCGEMMYWSTKEGKCLDARSKSKPQAGGAENGGWVSECMKGRAGC
jgi:hypothetical protein